MNRPLLAATGLSLALALGGCQLLDALPFGRSHPPVLYSGGVTPETRPVMYLGDALTFKLEDTARPPESVIIDLRHLASGHTKRLRPAVSEIPAFTVPLEASELPAYREGELNRYRVSVTNPSLSMDPESSTEFWVVSDRSIQPPPQSPFSIGLSRPNEWKAGGTVDELEAHAKTLATSAWQGKAVTLTRRKLAQDERQNWNGMPEEIEAWEFVVTGEFPQFVLTKDLNTLEKDAVVKPNRLRIVLSRSAPVYVLLAKAYEEQP
jgi:hypothetical protein